MKLRSYIDMLATGRRLHGRLVFQGLDISIENRKGSVRRGVDPDGKAWSTKMLVPYGYIRRSEGSDGEHTDCFIGPNEDAKEAYVIHIKNPRTGEYDEDKVFLGFDSKEAARKSFDEHYDKPERFFQSMDAMSMDDFKKVLTESKGEAIEATTSYGSGGYGGTVVMNVIPTSMKKGKSHVPANDPRETDDRFLDVTKRKSKESRAFDDEQTLHKGRNIRPVGTTGIRSF